MSQVAATMGMTTQGNSRGKQKLIQNWKMQQKKQEIQHSLARHRQQKPLTIWHLPDTMLNKAVETLPTVLNLAAAGGMDWATASDMVTDSYERARGQSQELQKAL